MRCYILSWSDIYRYHLGLVLRRVAHSLTLGKIQRPSCYTYVENVIFAWFNRLHFMNDIPFIWNDISVADAGIFPEN